MVFCLRALREPRRELQVTASSDAGEAYRPSGSSSRGDGNQGIAIAWPNAGLKAACRGPAGAVESRLSGWGEFDAVDQSDNVVALSIASHGGDGFDDVDIP